MKRYFIIILIFFFIAGCSARHTNPLDPENPDYKGINREEDFDDNDMDEELFTNISVEDPKVSFRVEGGVLKISCDEASPAQNAGSVRFETFAFYLPDSFSVLADITVTQCTTLHFDFGLREEESRWNENVGISFSHYTSPTEGEYRFHYEKFDNDVGKTMKFEVGKTNLIFSEKRTLRIDFTREGGNQVFSTSVSGINLGTIVNEVRFEFEWEDHFGLGGSWARFYFYCGCNQLGRYQIEFDNFKIISTP